jgi:hypothetical protein
LAGTFSLFSPPRRKQLLVAKAGIRYLVLLVLGSLLAQEGAAQVNLSGKPGLVYTPTARQTTDGAFSLGLTYNPAAYGMRARGTNPERVLFANLTILPRLDVNLILLQLIGTPAHPVREGIGDRQLDVRYLVLTEKSKRPALALILSNPFTVDAALVTYALVASKNLKLGEAVEAEVSAGVGSPYYIYRAENLNTQFNFWANYRLKKKSEDRYRNNYLAGPFGGLRLAYRQKGGLLAEWDAQMVNVGAYATLYKTWTIQAALLNFDQVLVSTSLSTNLAALPRRLRKHHEK